MNKSKVGLVNINVSFSGQNYFPYSIGLLQSYAQSHLEHPGDFEFMTPLYKKRPLEDCLEHFSEADLVFFSTSIWNSMLSAEIAKRLKEKKPETTIVFGGCSIPPQEQIEPFLSKRPFVDIACHGEGEKIFKAILENYGQRAWSNVPSISYRHNGQVVKTAPIPRISNLDDIPSPYLTGIFNRLMAENPNEGWIGLWETNRGCPFTCSYCEWGGKVGKSFYQFSLERLLKEIDWFSEHKVEFVRCCDSNFGLLPRDIELAKRLAENKAKFGYPKAVSVENTKSSSDRTFEIQRVLDTAGLSKGVNLAFQSFNGKTLEAIRRKNISNSEFQRLQHRFTKAGIPTFSDMIIGLPEETYDSFVDGITTLIEGGQFNSISFYNALVLPNSELARPEYKKKYSILTKVIRQACNHEQVEQEAVPEEEEIIIGTRTMPPQDWIKSKAFAWQVSLLYYDKLLQIPMTIAHEVSGISYRTLFESFSEVHGGETPIVKGINEFFAKRAKAIQDEGVPNHCESKRWLNMYWPADQMVLIKTLTEGNLGKFYEESEKIMQGIARTNAQAIKDAIVLNRAMLKQPNQAGDLELSLGHNIYEVYRGALAGGPVLLKRGDFRYKIGRTKESWLSWEDWCKRVVWWKHKRGEYLYSCMPVSGAK